MVGHELLGILGGRFLDCPILPSIQNPLGALPSRFRRQRLLIIGCGDVGVRVAALVRQHSRVIALTSSVEKIAVLRGMGITPLLGNLDKADSLARLSGLATRVLHLAPPAHQGIVDGRTRHLLTSLAYRTKPVKLVYGSTSGVYGDCGGQWVSEVRPVNAQTDRGLRRVNAEAQVRFFGRYTQAATCVLRIPGIYAPDREGGTPRQRLEKRLPVLNSGDDVYTNHIHADDLARACYLALWRGASQRVYHVNDDTELKMGDYVDHAADLYGLPRPPRVSREQALGQLAPSMLSFMAESRRLVNRRMKDELGLRLRYPTVHTGLL
jgi:nucleoside-diphosphate-sugar epimerase